MLDHRPLQRVDRIVRVSDQVARVHHRSHRPVRHAVGDRPIDGAAGEQPDDLAVLDHRIAFVTEAAHPIGGLPDGDGGVHQLGRIRHQIGHGLGRPHDFGQHGQQGRAHRLDGLVADQRRRGAVVAAAAEVLGDAGDVDRIRGGTGHELNMAVEPDQDEQTGRVEQVAQLVGQDRDLVLQPGRLGAGDDDRDPVDRNRLGRLQQAVVDLALAGGQGMVQAVGRQSQGSPLLQQPGDGPDIARRRPAVGQRAGVFVDAGQQQRGFDRIELGGALLQVLDQQRRRGPDHVQMGRPMRVERRGRRVVVDDVDLGAALQPFHRWQRLRVDQGDALDSFTRELFEGRQGQAIAVEGEEGPHIAIEPARQHRPRPPGPAGAPPAARRRRRNRLVRG